VLQPEGSGQRLQFICHKSLDLKLIGNPLFAIPLSGGHAVAGQNS